MTAFAEELSAEQRRMWFLNQLVGASPAQTERAAVRFDGELSEAALRKALEQLATRHEILRTTFCLASGRPMQRVDEEPTVRLNTTDLSGLEGSERDDAARLIIDRELTESFDLSSAPPWRAHLLHLCSKEHLLILAMHNIVCDGDWTFGPMIAELAEFYDAAVASRSPRIPSVQAQYREYVHRQRAWSEGPEPDQQLAFWRNALTGAPPMVELPTDAPRRAKGQLNASTLRITFPTPLVEQLESVACSASAELFSVLVSAFAGLCSRYTAQEDVVIGTISPGRSGSFDSSIGNFANPTVVRAHVDSTEAFTSLLQRQHNFMSAAGRNRQLPFDRVVDSLQVRRDRSRPPLFNVLLVMRPDAQAPITLDHCTLSRVDLDASYAQYELILAFRRTADGLECRVEFDTELYLAESINRIVAHYGLMLTSVGANPSMPVSAIPLLDSSERELLLDLWNRTDTNWPQGRCIHELFDEQATLRPDAIAVEFHEQTLSYAQLQRLANRLANRLRRLGVGPDVLVGISASRSFDMVVAMVAVWKAGGAYVPLDPAYPRDRLALMMEDSKIQVLLTQRTLLEHLPATTAETLCLDELDKEIAQESDSAPLPLASAHHLAYVIYTSGSTGRPKGVMVEHWGVANLVAAQQCTFSILPTSRIVQFASFSFDASLFEIVMALLSGARLVLASQDELMPGPELARLLVDKQVSVIVLPPSALAHLPAGEYPFLRTIIVAGEACPPDLVQRWGGTKEFFNAYGPTETTVWATVKRCLPSVERPSIGRPIQNTKLFVVDERRELVPVGGCGELLVGGVGLARGYLNRPELSAERFIELAFDGRMTKVYRTGDLVRYRSSGELDFLGRIDHQVKVRGFRIELGEIEAAIGLCKGVKDAVVIVRTDPCAGQAEADASQQDARVVAYLVPDGPESVDLEALRAHLRSLLPSYMVPTGFVMLAAFPLTPNGKVDRKALPLPEAEGPLAQYVAPRTEVEEQLAEIWSQLLRRQIGIHDSFFEAGGHSLLAAKALSMVREKFGISLPMRLMFDKPTIAELAESLGTGDKEAPPLSRTIPALPTQRTSPLSYAQQRIWFVDSIRPGNDAYNCPAAFRLSGKLDLKALAKSILEISRRHGSLRTTFVQSGEQLVQRISENVHMRVEAVDLSKWPDGRREAEASRLAREVAKHEFDLSLGPLLRVVVIRIRENDHLLIVNMHHIICDGWSIAIFFQELAALYSKARAGAPLVLPPLPIQYADFSVWQRDHLQDAIVAPQLSFWRQYLAGASPLLELPTDHARPSVPSFRGERIDIRLPKPVVDALLRISCEEGASLFMALLAAFATLLSRYSRSDDILIGIPTAGRNQKELQSLIGMFANILVVRTNLGGNPSFRTLLRHVRERTFSAFEHQDIPFERLVEDLRPARDLAYNPIVQVALVPQDMPFEAPQLEGVSATPHPIDRGAAQFDIVIFTRDMEGSLEIWAEYTTDLFKRETIERLLHQYSLLLEGAARNPDLPVISLPLLSREERERILVGWNDTYTDYPRDLCIHQIFEAHAARDPKATALDFDAQSMSFGELNQRANQLARFLESVGIGPGTLVGVCLPPCIDLFVSLLAVLKSGAAYVPLDPKYPQDRLGFMVTDARMPAILTRTGLIDWIGADQVRLLKLDCEATSIDTQSVQNTPSKVSADDLAYVIYTSGSTGLPKGVCIRHQGVVRLVLNTNHLEISSNDVVAQIANISFDAAEAEIWGALLNGAKLVGIPRDVSLSPEDFAETIRAKSVTTVLMTAPLFHQVAATVPTAFGAVKQLLVGGEALDPRWVRRILETAPPRRLINSYGPAESTVAATYHIVDKLQPDAPRVPIGRPISNTQIYVLDDHMEPMPLDVPGELYVGGDGLARGYWNREQLTAERFVDHPFSDRPLAKLYRTGDLVRLRSDGILEFLGRVDFQVKIRGVRIEPGEVEAVLAACPGVEQAVVVPKDFAPGDKRLVGYVVLEQGRQLTCRDMRDFLLTRLPEALVPSAFVVLPELPLTPNMKVDRTALPIPSLARASSSLAPRTPVEEGLAGIWREVLGVKKVGIDDSFFDLGGHSLLATRVLSRVRREFGVRVKIHQFFETPTIEALAAIIDPEGSWTPTVEEPSIVPTSSFGVIPLAHGQREFFRLHKSFPGLAFNLPIAFRIHGQLNAEALELSLDELIRRHEPLRAIFRDISGDILQIIAGPSPILLQRRNLTELPEERKLTEASQIAFAEAHRPFDIEQGPMLRAMLIRLGVQDHLFLINMHHIASDGWSLGVLFQEVAQFYRGFVTGKPATLPALSIQYRDYVMWQVNWVESEEGQAQLRYWQSHLEGAPRELKLPTDHERAPAMAFHGAQAGITLPGDDLRRLNETFQTEGATLFMTVLTAYAVLLSALTASRDVVIGTTTSSRTKRSTEGLIGCCFNKVALRIGLDGKPSFRQLLSKVRDATLGAFDHQDLPFDVLVNSLEIPKDGPIAPLVQVGYAPQDSGWEGLSLHGLELEAFPVNRAMAPLDLILYYQSAREGLRIWAEYRSDLFDASTIERWLEGLRLILTSAAHDSTVSVESLAALVSR